MAAHARFYQSSRTGRFARVLGLGYRARMAGALTEGQPAAAEFLAAKVLNEAGAELALGQTWQGSPVVLVFLRHFACIGCSEHVGVLAPRLLELRDLGIKTVFVGNGTPNFIAGFRERHSLGPRSAELVTDPSLKTFAMAGLLRSKAATVGPRAIKNAARAWLAGHRNSAVEGDAWQQGGTFVLDPANTVIYAHRDRALGDHPPTVDVVEAAMRTVVRDAVGV